MDKTGSENCANVDMSEKEITALLKYIYYYSVDDGVECAATAIELMHAGRRYNLPVLQNAMARILVGKAKDDIERNERSTTRDVETDHFLEDFADDDLKLFVWFRHRMNTLVKSSDSDDELKCGFDLDVLYSSEADSDDEVYGSGESKKWLGIDEAIQLYLWSVGKVHYKNLKQKAECILRA